MRPVEGLADPLARRANARREQIKELQRLAERQASIEADMATSIGTLLKAYAATSHEFTVVLQGRKEDLSADFS